MLSNIVHLVLCSRQHVRFRKLIRRNVEENSTDSGGFSKISSPESSSDDYSDHVEVAEEDVNVIRGAEPYRFEPLVRPHRVVEQDARDACSTIIPAGNNDRLTRRLYALMNPLQQSVLYILTLYLSHISEVN